MNHHNLHIGITLRAVICVVALLCAGSIHAQIAVNNGTMIITGGGLVSVNGGIQNTNDLHVQGDIHVQDDFINDGTSQGDGNLFVSGDFENNNTFVPDLSTVELRGLDQEIRGDSVTTFHNLNLTGSGVKYMRVDARSIGILGLNDRELAADTFTFWVDNPNTGAITTSAVNSGDSGFVSCRNNGYLFRVMQSDSGYFFPVGASDSALIYRPVTLTPSTSTQQKFFVRFGNVDATADNFDRALIDTSLCVVNPDYYHQLWRTEGTDSVGIDMTYDNQGDWDANTIAQWKTVSEWQDIGPVNSNVNPSPALSSFSLSNWGDWNRKAFAFARDGLKIAEVKSDIPCSDVDNGMIMLDVNGATAPYSYDWGGPAAGETSDYLTDLPAGVYPVTVTDFLGCSRLDTVEILDLGGGVTADAGNDTTIFAGTDASLQGSGGQYYQWSPSFDLDNDQSTDPTASPQETTEYQLIVSDDQGCMDTAYIMVTVDYNVIIDVPNVFSPNGDNANDYIFVQGTGAAVQDLEFVIFNRWGEKVFESTCCCNESCGWDGTYQGEQVNADVFVYMLKATVNGEEFSKHGNITVVRN